MVRSQIIRNHLISASVNVYPRNRCSPFREQLEGRSMLVRKLKIVPIECIVRGYLAGSGWKEYQQQRHGVRHRAARGVARIRSLPAADLHTVHQSGKRA